MQTARTVNGCSAGGRSGVGEVSLEMYYDSVKRCDVAKPGATDAHGGGHLAAHPAA